jgi:predicted ester cyclase
VPDVLRTAKLGITQGPGGDTMTPSEAAALVRELYDLVWSGGDLSAVDRLVAAPYHIHSDPGDPWEGRALDRAAYRERVNYSRRGFPDLQFLLNDLVPTGQRVAVRWSAEGTHQGDLPGLPATGRRLRFAGQTIYALAGGQVAGHWQVIDRLGFMQQLRAGPT